MYSHFPFPIQVNTHTLIHTHTERSARVTASLADTGAGVRFGWLKQRGRCFKASLLVCRPEDPQTAATASLHFRDQNASFRGLFLSFTQPPPHSPPPPLPPPPSSPLPASIHPHHYSLSLLSLHLFFFFFFFFFFFLMPPGADHSYLHVWGRRWSIEGERSW